jgi:ADP-ribosylglycohydrolase
MQDPFQAAMDAMEVSSVLQSGVQVTATSAIAAAVAVAMNPAATLDDVLDAGVKYSDEETSRWIQKSIQLAKTARNGKEFKKMFHETLLVKPTDALELVPEVIGVLAFANGEYVNTIIEAANFQRDVDTIAGMAGSISGALHGLEAIPEEWVDAVRCATNDQPSKDVLSESLYDALCDERKR